MLTNFELHPDGVLGLTPNQCDYRSTLSRIMGSRPSWPLLLNLGARSSDEVRTSSSRPRTQSTFLANWPFQEQQQHQQHQQTHMSQLPQHLQVNQLDTLVHSFTENCQQHRHEYVTVDLSQSSYESGLSPELPYESVGATVEIPVLRTNWKDFDNNVAPTASKGLPSVNRQSHKNYSPTNTYMDVISLPSITSENGWTATEQYSKPDTFQQDSAISNPSQTLHLRTNSDCSSSDCTGQTIESCTDHSYEDITYPYSPDSDSYLNQTKSYSTSQKEVDNLQYHYTSVTPVLFKLSPSRRSNSSVSASQSFRRVSASRKKSANRTARHKVHRISTVKKESEKRVGRRRGPLLPEQRKQASEIRKLRACLRCKFLKKTCDKGQPCAGCQPSHARLWQVPCTRIGIKDIAYFMKDWKADFESLTGLGFFEYSDKVFAQNDQLIWITHGYGFAIPVMARAVFVADDNYLTVSWVESYQNLPIMFNICTERFSTTSKNIPKEIVSEYLDKHVEGSFKNFIENHFEGTLFITDVLNTVYQYYVKEKVPVIQKALKLILAYNLTLHITFIEQNGREHQMNGLVNFEKSKFFCKTIAPLIINSQIKCALAEVWRELQSEVLLELSRLFSTVYSGDRFKNWPMIFMLASVLLILWEEIQFDSHYRMADEASIFKFCDEMESTPVGVIVGLFHAVSQKLPPITEWDTHCHGQLLNNNMAVCEAMSEMRSHIIKHENYLRTRPDAQFDPHDFDCLSNKLLSKLIIRAH